MDRTRTAWASLSDDQLLRECEVDTYRASGPGGQKRNKTSSAVRLRHPPSGLIVIAEESRSQHENRARALRRLRQALYLKIREPVRAQLQTLMENAACPEYAVLHGANGRLDWGRKDAHFWPAVGLVLDALQSTSGRVAEAAALLGISTGNLVHFLQTEPKVWEEANHLRVQFGQKPLKSS